MILDGTLFLKALNQDSRLSRRECHPGLLQKNDPRVRLHPRRNPLICLRFRVKTRELASGKTGAPCVKVPGSSRVPAPPWVGSRSPDGWDQIPYLPGGWVLHQPPWSFGFDSQTRGTRENRRTLCESTGFLTGPSPALGGLQIPRWLGSDPLRLSAWWLSLAPATLEFWVRFPNERNQGKEAHTVIKYLVPHGSQGLGLGSHSSSHAPLLLATLLSHNIPLPRVH